MEILYWIILMTFIEGILGFGGVVTFFIPKKTFQKVLVLMVAFATGSLIGGVFFHFLPEALEKVSFVLFFTGSLTGFFIFYLLEKYIHWRHCHEGICEVHPVNYLILYGDFIHNFIDGLIIASSFLISTSFGIVTSLLIIIHELPQEIGNFGILVYGGFRKNKALFYNFFVQLSSVIGGVVGFYFFKVYEYSSYLLPLAAGGFLYIALVDLVPEMIKKKNKINLRWKIVAVILGILLLLSSKIFIE